MAHSKIKPHAPPILPGTVLHEDFLKPLGMTANALALDLHIPANRLQLIVKGQRGITADTALRLARYFGSSAEFWLNLQQAYDLAIARQTNGESIETSVPRNDRAVAHFLTTQTK